MSSNASETYARLLLHHGHGYPLWVPEPNEALPQEYLSEGVGIGDVGIVTAGGSFDFLFNVFKSPLHPINQCLSGGLPNGFVPLPWDSRSLQVNSHQHRLGVPISSRGTQLIELDMAVSAPVPGTPVAIGGGIELRFSESRGAVLMLPNGASRVDYSNLKILREYAALNAENWYRFVNGRNIGREAENGSLYLITGCDKTSPWEVAAYSAPSHGQTISIKFTSPLADGKLCMTRSSTFQSFLSSRISNDSSTNNQAVFIRGFKISLQPGRWRMLFGSVKNTVKITPIMAGRLPKNVMSRGGVFSSEQNEMSLVRGGQASAEPREGIGAFDAGTPPSPSSDGDTPSDSAISSSVDSEEPVNVQIYHPSEIINDYMLNMSNAAVAVCHDKEWCSILNEYDQEIPNNEELIRRIQQKYEIGTSDSGYAFLTLRSSEQFGQVHPVSDSHELNTIAMLPLRKSPPADRPGTMRKSRKQGGRGENSDSMADSSKVTTERL
ncbi:hypothetical protein GYMLUDRAFT_62553 [Collybiopsis luxurians FD-317 M1]|uniref:Uncharacterized protein n=1 Tax=Collybiopsis luxurians FD-317 M1 TaxID=944289 RepID=A0A0D0AXU5_9AGAR|nr:hypothetical protein GYMLUDRAFT_62553 [Collybiopsis luxurians FD-317 M1]